MNMIHRLIEQLEETIESLEQMAVDMIEIVDHRGSNPVILPQDRELFTTLLEEVESLKDLIEMLRVH